MAHAGLELAALATNPLLRDSVCCVAAGLGAKVWTKVFDLLVTKGVLEQKLSRKLVHTTTGPIFILTWPLFRCVHAGRIMMDPCLACCSEACRPKALFVLWPASLRPGHTQGPFNTVTVPARSRTGNCGAPAQHKQGTRCLPPMSTHHPL